MIVKVWRLRNGWGWVGPPVRMRTAKAVPQALDEDQLEHELHDQTRSPRLGFTVPPIPCPAGTRCTQCVHTWTAWEVGVDWASELSHQHCDVIYRRYRCCSRDGGSRDRLLTRGRTWARSPLVRLRSPLELALATPSAGGIEPRNGRRWRFRQQGSGVWKRVECLRHCRRR